MPYDIAHFPIEHERAAALLEAHDHYRVLRALPPLEYLPLAPPAGRIRTAVLIDCETTGLDPACDRIIELAALRLAFGEDGRIVRVERCHSWREDPGEPLAPEISRLTGLADADLARRRIDETAVLAVIGDANMIIAHNAAFDASFVEARLPSLAGMAWACSLHEIDWAAAGHDGHKLGHLLEQVTGMFHSGHRAAADVEALLWLLAARLPSGITALSELVTTAGRSTCHVEAIGAPFAAKDQLKARQYRWNALRRVWWTEIPQERLDTELEWLRKTAGCAEPSVATITARERHR